MLALVATMVALAGATTLPATEITNTAATLNGAVDRATTARFQYTTNTTADRLPMTDPEPVTDGAVASRVEGLSADTTYFFRVVSSAGTGEWEMFRTEPNPTPPDIGSDSASRITTTTAHVSAMLDPNGAETTYYFQYGRTTSYGTRTEQLTVSGSNPVTVEADLTGLRPYTRYHWRLYARNAAGRTPGRDRTFRTARLASSLSLFSSRASVQWNRGVMLGGRVVGAGAGGMTLALEQQPFPFDRPFAPVATTHAGRDGGYLFSVDHVRAATRYRVVSRTLTPRTSPVVLVGAKPRTTIAAGNLSRKRARIAGTITPAVIGEISLQRKRASGGWTQVRHRTLNAATMYSFKVWRLRKTSRSYRVVVLPVRGAYSKATSRKVVVSRRPGRARG